jgi:hypothetical protein
VIGVSTLIAGVPFDLYAGQFSAGESASILKMKPGVLAMQTRRGVSPPTRRGGVAGSARKKKRERQGKALFSLRDLIKIQTQQTLSEMGFSLTELVPVGDQMKLTPEPVAARLSAIEAAYIAGTIAMEGEWMWAMARSIERGQPFLIYAYATRTNNKWQLDMHIDNPGVESPTKPPCFGWKAPLLYLPVSEIFIGVYSECKKVLGLPGKESSSKDVR